VSSPRADEILHAFDLLPDKEKFDVLAEIVRRSSSLESPPLTDEDFTSIADSVFSELDRDELQDG
jgi:hypothetical protein